MLKLRFFGTMYFIVGFHDAWCAEVAEVLKDNPRFNDIFVAGKLVEIGDVVISGQAALERLEADTAGVREQIENVILLIQEFRIENANAHEQTQMLVGVEMNKRRLENEALRNALLQIREFASEVAISSERIEANSLRREF